MLGLLFTTKLIDVVNGWDWLTLVLSNTIDTNQTITNKVINSFTFKEVINLVISN